MKTIIMFSEYVALCKPNRPIILGKYEFKESQFELLSAKAFLKLRESTNW